MPEIFNKAKKDDIQLFIFTYSAIVRIQATDIRVGRRSHTLPVYIKSRRKFLEKVCPSVPKRS